MRKLFVNRIAICCPYVALRPSRSGSINPGSPVSLDWFDRRPYAFEGKVSAVRVQLT
jgi:hypothetical protein